MADSESQCILVVGNVVDGLNFIGPFDDEELATEYVTKNKITEEWSIAELEDPEFD